VSVVAYRGGVLAADRQATIAGMRFLHDKIGIYENHYGGRNALATTGNNDSARAMLDWWNRGYTPGEFPKCQESDECWARLIIMSTCEWPNVWTVERTPSQIPVYPAFMAWGLGAEYAMAVMWMGAHAVDAVRAANSLSIYCGCGIKVVRSTTDGLVEEVFNA